MANGLSIDIEQFRKLPIKQQLSLLYENTETLKLMINGFKFQQKLQWAAIVYLCPLFLNIFIIWLYIYPGIASIVAFKFSSLVPSNVTAVNASLRYVLPINCAPLANKPNSVKFKPDNWVEL